MALSTTNEGSRIGLYIYVGLVFLLWENLVSSLIGIYHLELRRTLWGIIYYSLLFLVFGGVVEGFTFLQNRLLSGYRWFGQKWVWLLTLLVIFLWGDISRQLLSEVFTIKSIRLSYLVNLLWLPLICLIGLVVNIFLARLDRVKKLPDSRYLMVYYSAFVLFLIVSTKVAYRYFQHDIFSTKDILLQPAFIVGTLLVAGIVVKLFTSSRSFRWALIWIPIAITFTVIGLSAGVKSINRITLRPAQPLSDQPNIVVMLFDALRADHVGPNAEGYSLTPTMDSLAQEGRHYSSCYATSSWTFPSVVSLLTSKLPNKLGLLQRIVLPPYIPMLPGILGRNGYRTMGLSANGYVVPEYGFDRSFDEFYFLPGKGTKQVFLPFRTFFPCPRVFDELAYQFGFISTDLHVADWQDMNKRAAYLLEKTASKPFFLYMHFMDTHFPYLSQPFKNGIFDLNQVRFAFYIPELVAARQAGKLLIESEFLPGKDKILRTQRMRYEGGVQTTDLATAEMMENIRLLGLAENTVIIILSDHGEAFFEHRRGGHGSSLFEEQIAIPLIIHIPPAFQISLPDQPTGISILDVTPTVLDLAGVDSKILRGDGWSLLHSYPDSSRPRYMILEQGGFLISATVLSSHKLIIINDREGGKIDTMLFDLSTDREEKVNLYPEEKYLADSLAFLLQVQLDQTVTAPKDSLRELLPQEIERLKALGYID